MQTIGSRGEVGAALLIVDVSDVSNTYPNAKYSVVVQRSGGTPYPVASNLKADGDQIIWAVDAYTTGREGKIEIEIQARQGDAVIKSFKWPFYVSPSVSSGHRHCHDHHERHDDCSADWMDQLLSKANDLDTRIDDVFAALENDIDTQLILEPYPDVDALPVPGEQGKIYLVLTEDGTSALYTYNENVPEYVSLTGAPSSGSTEPTFAEYPDYLALPDEGEQGVLYLTYDNSEGAATFYVWTGDPAGYVEVSSGGGGSTGLLPGTIIDCSPIII